MWNAMDLYNVKNLRELVLEKIIYLFNKKWDLEDFIQTGLWKPEKQNITLNKFVARMKEEGKPLPEVYERFSFVLVKRYPYKYDLRGRQIELSKSDQMEYVDVVLRDNLEIDLKYYFDKELTGQFARLISYDKEFTVYTHDSEIDEMMPNDKKTMNVCIKYIKQLAKQHGNNYIDRNKIFKDMFKIVTKKYKENKAVINNVYSDNKYNILFNSYVKIGDNEVNLHMLINDNIDSYLSNTYNFDNMSAKIVKIMTKDSDNAVRRLYNSKGNSFYTQQQKQLNIQYAKQITDLVKKINENNLNNVIFNADNVNVYGLVRHLRDKYDVDSICGKNDVINSVYDIIDEDTLEEELKNTDVCGNMDKIVVDEIYKEYVNLICVKKNIRTNEYIYNSFYDNIMSTPGHMHKPRSFRGL